MEFGVLFKCSVYELVEGFNNGQGAKILSYREPVSILVSNLYGSVPTYIKYYNVVIDNAITLGILFVCYRHIILAMWFEA